MDSGLSAVLGLLALVACGDDDIPTPQPTATAQPDASAMPEAMTEDNKEGEAMIKNQLPRKIVAPHFVDSYPNHGDVLAQAPEKLVLNFNFNLHPDSAISVTRDGEEVSLGPIVISDSKLSMQEPIEGRPPDGVYEVEYSACWPDQSCHEGITGFVVDSATVGEYDDLRGHPEVTILMTEGDRFDANKVMVSPGTKIVWVNETAVDHFLNSDPHPSHNVLGELNSTNISSGESFSYTFQEPGAWGYHCSAHFNLGMTAQILVK